MAPAKLDTFCEGRSDYSRGMPHPFPARHEVRYERPVPGPPRAAGDREVDTLTALGALFDAGHPLRGLRLQGLDLTAYEHRLLERDDVTDLVVLGGSLSHRLEEHLRKRGAIIFPTDPDAPVNPYRGTLYTAEELYAGLAEHGYAATPDARAYAWLQDATVRHDAYVTVLRAIHDDAMSDALMNAVADRRVVGVMGGHALARDGTAFAAAAELGHRLARSGALVATGGGPGAMEAGNLGAWCADEAVLRQALRKLAEVPDVVDGIGPWAAAALAVRRSLGPAAPSDPPRALRSIGIPTWHYGHEPPNAFGDLIAKFFSNALREELLLHYCTAGLVVLPGAAGTVQEVFQMATRLYYKVEGRVPPLVLVGVKHWTDVLPVWPLLQALGRGRAMATAIHLVDSPEEAADLVG